MSDAPPPPASGPTPDRHAVAVVPDTRPPMHEALSQAVTDAGGRLAEPAEATAIVWADPAAAHTFPAIRASAPHLAWVQLPYAGIEPFAEHLSDDLVWTCGKGVYARPVAEHALAAALAGLRGITTYARRRTWSEQMGTNLHGGVVTVLGGGGITRELIEYLRPFRCEVRVVRRSPAPMSGAASVVGPDRCHEAASGALVLVVALALTDETRGIVDADLLARLDPRAWVVNVARGGHVVHDDLLAALREGTIGGAVLDVTDPEPLPDDHPLWSEPHCVITPHVGNTAEMGLPLLAERVHQNVARWIGGRRLIGQVDPAAGY